ncbi:Ada metal-binding domain-containing protein [Micromonospora chersina]
MQWQCEAIQPREERLDGGFLAAVKTTGTCCRPPCRAKPSRGKRRLSPDGGQRRAR